MSSPRLGSTYRLQLRPGFGFAEAAELAGYLADLGVELAYLSPIFEAVPGSQHGYDGVDPGAIRAELGGADGFATLVCALQARQLGILLDIVPNHLSTWPMGPWWGDMLRLGRGSVHAAAFDVDWEAGGGKVTIPVLDAPLEDVLASGELTVSGDRLFYGALEFPLLPGSGAAGDPRRVIGTQHYRLAPWRDARARNYRRFFDIDGLAGLRVEDPDVFERSHRLVAELVASGAVQALRVDHVDGLADPGEYLGRLRELTGVPIVVEKILTGDERLPIGWPVTGTTGYEALDDMSGALVDPGGMLRLVRRARRYGDRSADEVGRECKALMATTTFAAELEASAGLLGAPVAETVESAVALPVYRTYVGQHGPSPEEAALLEATAAKQVAAAFFDPGSHLAGIRRFQQVTGPVMAKGIEDTAWYRLVGPLPFLEVGGDPAPERWRSDGADRMHARAAERAARGQHGLVPGTTHDTKRSGDVRARLLALAEVTHEFEAGLVRLAELAPSRPVVTGPPVPDARERRLVAATLLGMAPLGDEGWDDLARRIEPVLEKSAREAKQRSSWVAPTEDYEAALVAFAQQLIAGRGALLNEAFGDLVDKVATFGAVLSLAQVVLRSSLPGVPDCYQGDETWNLSLVDPDNRRPVDFAPLADLASSVQDIATASPEDVGSLRALWRDGRVKLHVTAACLRARRAAPLLFGPDAGYLRLEAHGPHAASAVAFARLAPAGIHGPESAGPRIDGPESAGPGSDGPVAAVTVVTRFPRRLASAPDDMPVSRRAWGNTWIDLPPGAAAASWVDALTGLRHEPIADGSPTPRLELGTVLSQLPVALLIGEAGT